MKRLALPAVALAAALSLTVASPAVAAENTLHPGDSVYAIACDRGVSDPSYPAWQLLGVDASTGASTAIGSGRIPKFDLSQPCALQPAYNPATGASYYIEQAVQFVQVPGNEFLVNRTSLAQIDVATGVSTAVGGAFEVDITAMAIGLDGAAYAIGQNGHLYSLNLTSGALTEISSTIGLPNVSSFAVDPTTGAFWAIGFDRSGTVLFTVDVAAGTKGIASTATELPGLPGSLQIDGAGRFWEILNLTVEPTNPGGSSLWSFTPSTFSTPVESGDLVDGPYFSQALLLIPSVAATLAATGTTSFLWPLLGGSAVGLLAAGLLLVRVRRRA